MIWWSARRTEANAREQAMADEARNEGVDQTDWTASERPHN
jgi:hypothetical protein